MVRPLIRHKETKINEVSNEMNSTNPILRCFKSKKLNPERQKKNI